MKFLFPLCAVLSTTHWWGLYLRLYVRLYKPNVHWLCSEGGNNFVLCGSMDFYDMAVTLTYSWLPYPPDWRFWYSDPNTLSCFFAPSPWKGTISELYVPRQHWLWGVFFFFNNHTRIDFGQDSKHHRTGNDFPHFHITWAVWSFACCSLHTLSRCSHSTWYGHFYLRLHLLILQVRL